MEIARNKVTKSETASEARQPPTINCVICEEPLATKQPPSTETPTPPVHLGPNPRIDPGVLLGYLSPRKLDDPTLTIGANPLIRSGSVIYAGSRIGANLQTGHNVIIREQNSIGDDLCIWSNSIIDYGCTIGSRVRIHSNVYIPQYTEIEDEVFIAPGATFANDPHPGCTHSAECMRGPLLKKGCQIGVNVTVLPFVTIGEEAVIGSGAVIVKDVPPRSVVVGNPGRVICTTDDLRCTHGLTDYPYRQDGR
jgi:acetyltransferase-like isoleucine patch superfamily enzyme